MTTQNKNNTDISTNKTSITTVARIAAALSLSLTGLAMTTSMASAITPPSGTYEPGDVVANPDTPPPTPPPTLPPITRPEAPDDLVICDDSISDCGSDSGADGADGEDGTAPDPTDPIDPTDPQPEPQPEGPETPDPTEPADIDEPVDGNPPFTG